MRAKRFLAGVAAGVTALAVVGCADQIKQLEPKLELRNAAQQLGEQKQAGFTLKLTGSADDLVAAVRKEDPDAGADDTEALKKLFNSSVTIAYDQAGPGPDDDRVSLAATIDGVTGTELRVVDKVMYVKAPVADLVGKFGDAGDVAELRDEATAADPALKALFDGGWVSVDAGELVKTSGLPTQDTDSAKAAAEVKKSARNLFDGAEIVRDPADGKHLIVTTSTTKAYSELKRLVTAIGGDDTKALTGELGKAPKDHPIVVDLWIDNEKLTALEIDVLQFADGATGRAAVRLEVTTGAPIEAPPGATKVDPKLLAGVAGPAGASSTAGGRASGLAMSLGYGALAVAEQEGITPAKALPKAIDELADMPFRARVVRAGVAEVTVGSDKACVKVPATTSGDPKVSKGAC
ncbi:hypothetical protein ACFQS1_20560 [Paractinoplanes rhizophilus]|uniref:Lipoprotein n=1 Tax=Paractinoplanes rhizophilus TaxID=1416877 RepID=A0ABW2HTF0_9ACTN